MGPFGSVTFSFRVGKSCDANVDETDPKLSVHEGLPSSPP